MKVVTFSIFKGGTGKTTSTVSTAAALAKKGMKVLIVDLDQQASATRYLDLDPEASPNLYEVFTGHSMRRWQSVKPNTVWTFWLHTS